MSSIKQHFRFLVVLLFGQMFAFFECTRFNFAGEKKDYNKHIDQFLTWYNTLRNRREKIKIDLLITLQLSLMLKEIETGE